MIKGFSPANKEEAQQLELLNSPVGPVGSGYVRYGAAMYFYRQNRMSAQLLEIYRICCKLDAEDPVVVAGQFGFDR